eukprot:Skav233587  [mRNA]  locus=scaffold2520:297954:305786:- [translate_table: standard]
MDSVGFQHERQAADFWMRSKASPGFALRSDGDGSVTREEFHRALQTGRTLQQQNQTVDQLFDALATEQVGPWE